MGLREVSQEDVLSITGLSLRFGGTQALDDVSLDVADGNIVGIIGPNGAGKSSLLNCVSGFYRAEAGAIVLEGVELTRLQPFQVARLGVARTFQNVELFRDASALENIMLGRHLHMKTSVLAAALRWGPGLREEVRHRRKVEEVIAFLEIERLRHVAVGKLSYGQQKLVEIGRAMAVEPKLLLLDEPTSGMNREEKEDVARFLLRLKYEMGLTQVLIEHDTRFIGDLCDSVVVLDFGKLIASGVPRDVLRAEAVVEAYVGRTATEQ